MILMPGRGRVGLINVSGRRRCGLVQALHVVEEDDVSLHVLPAFFDIIRVFRGMRLCGARLRQPLLDAVSHGLGDELNDLLRGTAFDRSIGGGDGRSEIARSAAGMAGPRSRPAGFSPV